MEEGEVLLTLVVSEFGAAMSMGSPEAVGGAISGCDGGAMGRREVEIEDGTTRRAPIDLSWPSDIRIDG